MYVSTNKCAQQTKNYCLMKQVPLSYLSKADTNLGITDLYQKLQRQKSLTKFLADYTKDLLLYGDV